MSSIDWTILGNSKRGLAVEGKDDKVVIEAFLDAGETAGHWQDWRAKIWVEDAESRVIQALEAGDNRIWGLIDRDWRTDAEIAALQAQHPRLLVLPRTMIENYCIDPTELDALLPLPQKISDLTARVDAAKADWVSNGALWQSLHEQGAFRFCRGHESGYPMALLHHPITEERDLEARFLDWHSQLDPAATMASYRRKHSDFKAAPSDHTPYSREKFL